MALVSGVETGTSFNKPPVLLAFKIPLDSRGRPLGYLGMLRWRAEGDPGQIHVGSTLQRSEHVRLEEA